MTKNSFVAEVTFKPVHMFQPGTSIANNDIARYLPEIPLPNLKSTTHRRIPILQVVNKIVSIRLTPKLFTSLSKVYMNKGGAD